VLKNVHHQLGKLISCAKTTFLKNDSIIVHLEKKSNFATFLRAKYDNNE